MQIVAGQEGYEPDCTVRYQTCWRCSLRIYPKRDRVPVVNSGAPNLLSKSGALCDVGAICGDWRGMGGGPESPSMSSERQLLWPNRVNDARVPVGHRAAERLDSGSRCAVVVLPMRRLVQVHIQRLVLPYWLVEPARQRLVHRLRGTPQRALQWHG